MLTIQQLSQELGIGSDTLRIWERRYGFPQPQRDRRGHRCYPEDQVDALRVVQKLKILGQRPNAIFKLSSDERQKLLSDLQGEPDEATDMLLNLVRFGSYSEIEKHLSVWAKKGCTEFVFSALLPLVDAMNSGWTRNQLSVAREHMISDLSVRYLMRFQQQYCNDNPHAPHCLFTTINGERHKLGLLMAACLLAYRGVRCTVIYEDLPLTEIQALCEEANYDAVALSFSSHYSRRQAMEDLSALRRMLPQTIDLIVGGHSVHHVTALSGVLLCTDLSQIDTIAGRLIKTKRLHTGADEV